MTAGEGHNSVLNQGAQGQIKSIVERVERLEVEKAEVAEQIKEVFAEAKANGFDVKILRKVVKLRKTDAAKRAEEDAILDLYLSALGELPLFETRDDSTRVTISLGDHKIETTTDGLKRAAAAAR